MGSETFVARELFASLWNLMIIGAVKHCCAVEFPFDKQLVSFVEHRRQLWQHILQDAKQFGGFQTESMMIATECSPWEGISNDSDEYTHERLSGELLMACKATTWDPIDFGDTHALSERLLTATEWQLVDMFDSLLQARYCFGSRSPTFYDALDNLLHQAFVVVATTQPVDDTQQYPAQKVYGWWVELRFAVEVQERTVDGEYLSWLRDTIVREFENRRR